MRSQRRSILDSLKPHRAPDRSFLYDQALPVVFAVLGVVTLALILFALGVLTGLIHWR